MRYLVTGSEGFIGRHLCKAIQARDDEVIGCDPTHGWNRSVNDWLQLSKSLANKVDYVIHLAALVGGREGIDSNAALIGAYNAQLDGAFFQYVLRTKPRRAVYFSSAAVYPVELQQSGKWLTHGLPENKVQCHRPAGWPDNTYGWAKLTGEVWADCANNDDRNVHISVVRPFSSYGEDQDDCYPFPQFIARAKRRDNPFVIWGDGTQARDFIHIDDLVDAVLDMIDLDIDGPVNLGTGIATSFNQLAQLVCDAEGYQPEFVHDLTKPVGVHHRVADVTRMSEFYTPKITIAEGVARCWEVRV